MGDTTDRAKIITICGDAKLCGDTEVSVETKSRLEKYFHTARELTLQGDLVILPYANIYGDIHKISALQLVKSNAANTQAISISDGIYDIETKENNNSEGKTKIRDRNFNKIKATTNTVGSVNKLVTVFAGTSCPKPPDKNRK
jgi:hypothetical protein